MKVNYYETIINEMVHQYTDIIDNLKDHIEFLKRELEDYREQTHPTLGGQITKLDSYPSVFDSVPVDVAPKFEAVKVVDSKAELKRLKKNEYQRKYYARKKAEKNAKKGK